MASQQFLEADRINSLDDVRQKLDRSCLPNGIIMVEKSGGIIFISLNFEGEDSLPVLGLCLKISEDLLYSVWIDHRVPVLPEKFSHITCGQTFSNCSEILNVLALAKSFVEEHSGNIVSDKIQHCQHVLHSILPDLDQHEERKMAFAIEQIDLAVTSPKRRRYSPTTLAMTALWLNVSTAGYKYLLRDDVLTLPSISHLKSLCSSLSTSSGFSQQTRDYLRARASSLNDRERIVSLIIDEVYNAKRVEFSSGKFFGFEDGHLTKTLLGVMISSVAGSFKDMVALVPVTKMDSNFIHSTLEKTLEILKEADFRVVSILADGHSVNRKLFTHNLGGGEMKTTFVNPYDAETPIHLIFDPTHLFKNLYTNLLNKGEFNCPPFEGQNVTPCFNHVKELYELELTKPVKISHKLIQKVLTPRPIERTNVMLADRFFHESTIAGLEFYSGRGHPEWQGTANFLKLVRKWWDIMIVKTTGLGKRKRKEDKDPIRSNTSHQLEFLEQFCIWLQEWKLQNNFSKALSSETFQCIIQTCKSLPQLVVFLLNHGALDYVLVGKISSDPIERHFGKYRQMAGANYFISVRQILESEKRIRLKSLVKFTKLSLNEIREVFEPSCDETNNKNSSDARALLSVLQEDMFMTIEVERDDEAVIYFVAGYLARGLIKRNPSDCCVQLLQATQCSPILTFDEECDSKSEDKASLIDQVNRGGLVTPSDLVYFVCQLAHTLFKAITNQEIACSTFMKAENQRKTFGLVFMDLIKENLYTETLLDEKCMGNHEFKPMMEELIFRFFNVFAKNYSSKLNDNVHEQKKRSHSKGPSTNRKVSKLQG